MDMFQILSYTRLSNNGYFLELLESTHCVTVSLMSRQRFWNKGISSWRTIFQNHWCL